MKYSCVRAYRCRCMTITMSCARKWTSEVRIEAPIATANARTHFAAPNSSHISKSKEFLRRSVCPNMGANFGARFRFWGRLLFHIPRHFHEASTPLNQNKQTTTNNTSPPATTHYTTTLNRNTSNENMTSPNKEIAAKKQTPHQQQQAPTTT